jgi:hypothetical protein
VLVFDRLLQSRRYIEPLDWENPPQYWPRRREVLRLATPLRQVAGR